MKNNKGLSKILEEINKMPLSADCLNIYIRPENLEKFVTQSIKQAFEETKKDKKKGNAIGYEKHGSLTEFETGYNQAIQDQEKSQEEWLKN